jgi:regulator of replication initiation timing
LLFLMALPLAAQDLSAILARLEKLESENRELRQEVKQLRELVEGKPTLPERVDIVEKRVEEQASTKVESANRFPITLTGMALFQTFYNTRGGNGNDVSTAASAVPGRVAAGATLRQSVIGLRYHGPETFLGGRIGGSLFMDFYDGGTEGANTPFRIRTGEINLDWKTRSLSFGLMRPLISPHDPNSFSFVGISPLTGSGNLWRWQPQARFEQRAGWFRGQVAVMQTNEESTGAAAGALNNRRRPGLEFRGSVVKEFDEVRRVEFGAGGHVSESRVSGQQLPSRIASVDWLVTPVSRLTLSGLFFNGENVHHLGALRQSFRAAANGTVSTVHSRGGWAQASVPLTQRVTLNIFGGVHDDRNADLVRGQNGANRTGAANLMWRVAPNVIVSLEAMQIRSHFVGLLQRRVNRYDLAIAYLF